MKLRPALYSFIVEDLKQLARLCGGPCPDGARKEQLVEYIAGRLTDPVALEEVWRRLDPLSRKAVATAYHAGGEFAPEAFVAQYGELPGQMAGCLCSLYEGLIFFRINPLGAYLFGQAGEYESPLPLDDPHFSIDSELVLTFEDPSTLTSNLRQELGRFTVEQADRQYRLDTGRVLDEIERGEDLRYVADFLERHHGGLLPEHVSLWLQELAANRGAFKRKSDAARPGPLQ